MAAGFGPAHDDGEDWVEHPTLALPFPLPPPQGRVTCPQPVPQAWLGVGGDRPNMPPRPPGTVYRSRPGWRKLITVGIWVGIILGAIAAGVIGAVLKILIL